MDTTATFIDRSVCIACGSSHLSELSHGAYDSGPVGEYLAADPWGESPLPYLARKTWHFVKCDDCAQMFHRFVLDAEWNERRFAKWMTQDAIAAFESTALQREWQFQKAAENIAHVLRIRSLKGTKVKLLDFGCGYGEFVAICNLHGFRAVGVDRSEAKRSNALTPISPSLSDLSGPFDVITLFEVLEHLDQPLQVLQQLTAITTPGGILILETPDCTGVTDIKTLDDYRKIHPLDHINAFTPATLSKIAARAGFESIPKPTAHVTTQTSQIAKTGAKALLSAFVKPTTRQYFRKVS